MRKPYVKVQYNSVGLKMCTQCEEYKNLFEFHKYSASKDGLKQICKKCVKEYDDKEHDPKRVFPNRYRKDGFILCRRCDEFKPPESFSNRNDNKKIKKTYCKKCTIYIGHVRSYDKYKITPEDYLEMEKSQGGVCKICKNDNNGKRLMVDHDHKCCPGVRTCGRCIRGLLCKNCNWALGNAKEDILILQKMIEYLNCYKSTNLLS